MNRRSMCRSLTFEQFEDRCLLSCPPAVGGGMGGMGAPPIPDPPEHGAYTHEGAAIQWTCTRPTPTDVIFQGVAQTANPFGDDYLLTVSVIVNEGWSLVNNNWVMLTRFGSATEVTQKTAPATWQERQTDYFVIDVGGDHKTQRDYYLNRTDNQADLGILKIDTDQWTERYSGDQKISKVGYVETAKIPNGPKPNTGNYNFYDERHEWDGPVQWTKELKDENDRSYFNGFLTHIHTQTDFTEREFAQWTDTSPSGRTWQQDITTVDTDKNTGFNSLEFDSHENSTYDAGQNLTSARTKMTQSGIFQGGSYPVQT
jgi:hypothetical protein